MGPFKNMFNSSMTNFCYLSNDVICILKPVGPKMNLSRVITLPHFPLLQNAPNCTINKHSGEYASIPLNIVCCNTIAMIFIYKIQWRIQGGGGPGPPLEMLKV